MSRREALWPLPRGCAWLLAEPLRLLLPSPGKDALLNSKLSSTCHWSSARTVPVKWLLTSREAASRSVKPSGPF